MADRYEHSASSGLFTLGYLARKHNNPPPTSSVEATRTSGLDHSLDKPGSRGGSCGRVARLLDALALAGGTLACWAVWVIAKLGGCSGYASDINPQ
jgi:hypothetical protein